MKHYCDWCWKDREVRDARCTHCGHNPRVRTMGCQCDKCKAEVRREQDAKQEKRAARRANARERVPVAA